MLYKESVFAKYFLFLSLSAPVKFASPLISGTEMVLMFSKTNNHMDIIIQSLGFPTSETLNAFINERVNQLKSDTIVRANVTMYIGSDGNPENQICEIRLEVPGNDLFVKRGTIHFETAVSECVDILQKQIKKNRDKSVDRRHADENMIQDELMAGEEDETEPELEDIVK